MEKTPLPRRKVLTPAYRREMLEKNEKHAEIMMQSDDDHIKLVGELYHAFEPGVLKFFWGKMLKEDTTEEQLWSAWMHFTAYNMAYLLFPIFGENSLNDSITRSVTEAFIKTMKDNFAMMMKIDPLDYTQEEPETV